MIPRRAAATILKLAKGFPVVAVTGPRGAGKTTLVRSLFPQKPFLSFEEPDKFERAAADPRGFLETVPEGAVIDEVQRLPGLFPFLHEAIEARPRAGMFILTASQDLGSFDEPGSPLCGRIGRLRLLPLAIAELADAGRRVGGGLPALLYKGLYPHLHDHDSDPAAWYGKYVMSFLERDVRRVLNVRNLAIFQKFLRMCAGRVGSLLNLSSLAADCGITHNTAQSWLQVLEAGMIVFLLRPHPRTFGKRLVKSPKLYFHDPGLASWLLGVQGPDHAAIHPQRGGLFEGLIIAELLKSRANAGLASNLFFWRNNLGDEIDVVVDRGLELWPVEIKSGETLAADALKTLKKWRTWAAQEKSPAYLVYGGREASRSGGVGIVPWERTSDSIQP